MAAAEGRHLSLTAWGAGAPAVLVVHATGFCKEVWQPVVRRMTRARLVVAVDQRGHGDSPPVPGPCDWWDLGRDLLRVIDHLAGRRPVGLGHSSGGAALVMAELLRPGTFSALLLVEPIIFPPPYFRAADNPMSAAARRRRAAFPSPDAACSAWRGRGAFRGWTAEALDLYVAHALREQDGAWVLKCSPEVEAEFYRGATAHGAWERLGEVACPVVLVVGAGSDTYSGSFGRALAARFAAARLEVVEGAGHFVPMERPGALAAILDALEPDG